MSADVLIFNLFRRLKRRWSREAMAALSQSEVDEINAVLADWKKGQNAPVAAQEPATARPEAPKAGTALSDPGAFYAALRVAFNGMTQDMVDGTNTLLGAVGAAGWPIAYVAYALATARHETARTMQPIKERGGEAYFHRMYDINGNRPAKARELGNVNPGDGAKYAGRGYVQLTGRFNYDKAGKKLGVDLVASPDLAMQPDIAAKILVWGMETGAFTGKALRNYLPERGPAGHRQFMLARYIINGQDMATDIADMAMQYQTALQAGGWS